MLERFHRHKRTQPKGSHRSGLEQQVEEALVRQGFRPDYEAESFPFVLHRKYTPDFRVGNVYVEVKGWWPPGERTKFLAVIVNNPGLRIFVALQRPHMTLSKKSKTTYAEWCNKYGIAWCPIPIPPEFMSQWQNGQRVTFHAQEKTAKVQTQQCSIPMDLSTALAANQDTASTENHGGKE